MQPHNVRTIVPVHRQRLQADLALLSVAVIWGSAFVVQRLAAPQVGVFIFNGLRFLLAALALLPLAWFNARRMNGKRAAPSAPQPGAGLQRKHLGGMLLAGMLLWGAAALQQAGLRYTTAGNAGFITGLYVVLVPLILALAGRARPSPSAWTAALLAVLGLFLLSTGGSLQANPGDLLELLGAVFWALHVILIGALVQEVDVLPLAIGQYLACALFSLASGLALEADTLPGLSSAWQAVVYTGLLSVGIGYTLQAFGQRQAPPADAAILLSMEAVFAALFGWWFLGEALNGLQILGCAVMLAGMLLAQVRGVAAGKQQAARGE